MKRTQLYLDEEASRFLAAESRRRGTTVSSLVREAVAAAYGSPDPPSDRAAVIQRVAAVWAERSDLPPTRELVRELRQSTRGERLEEKRRAKVPARQRRNH